MRKILLLPTALFCCAIASAQTVGVCCPVNSGEVVAATGADYLEENVQRFLVPEKSEAEFEANLLLARKSPLKIYACNSFMPGTIKVTGPDVDLERAVKYSEVALRRADKADIRVLVYGSSGARNVPDGFSRKEAVKQLETYFKAIAPIAKKYNVVIVLEPLQKSESNIINTVAEGIEMVKKVNNPNFKCLGDFYHMLAEGESPQVIVDNAKYLRHFHVAELKERAAPGTYKENIQPYYDALKKINYKGGLSVECNWKDFDKEVTGAVKTVNREYLDK